MHVIRNIGGMQMYKRMLVPLDGSELAEVVLPYAKELAGRLDLEVILLHVCEPHRSESQFMCQSYIEHAAEIAKTQSREVQTKTGAPEGGKAVEARGEVVTGHPAEEIIKYASENNIDVILMATHGRSGVKRWVLGSVADKVLRASQIPIWLVRAAIPEEIIHDEWPKRTMLVPLDGSKLAESVLPHVEALAKQRGAELINIVLLRVFEEPYVNADYPEASMNLTWKEHVRRIREHFKQEAERYLIGVQNRLTSASLKVRSEVLMGNPADEIISYAHKNHPNLVVLASHGYSGIGRWEYGSVADKVLHGVSSPIFMVRLH
jgi:nucleotide-binding universal stress UspA family protein